MIFRGKASLLRIKRGFENLADDRLKQHSFSKDLIGSPVVAESRTPLWTESAPEEQFLLAGKVQNLRQAVGRLNGLEIPRGEIFSFWKHVGRASRRRGYTVGRELREGCIIPNVGGGLCQISNALYDAALKAGFEIVERHAHTQVIEGSLAERGRDATVFWNYVDLRFRSPRPFRIEAFLGRDHLSVKFKSEAKEKKLFRIIKPNSAPKSEIRNPKSEFQNPNSCASCGVESCFRSLKPEKNLNFGRTAFLLDEFSPEFDRYVQTKRESKDDLFIPLDGRRFRKPNYAWDTGGFSHVKQSFVVTGIRSYRSRRLAAQGAARQNNLLEMYEKLAADYARKLPYDALHLIVQQNLLPFLWKSGALGGRSFDVLMTALPMSEIQNRLDRAFALHPESRTLADFRADQELLEAERRSLENASKIITPHSAIASLFPRRAELLDWKIPAGKETGAGKNGKPTIVFPATTVGRKGCYELREAIRDLDVKLITLGPFIEDEDFWRGFDVEKNAADWLERADLIVLPAFVEHRPRRLLQAVAAGLPVIASRECGLENVPGAESVESGRVDELRILIEKLTKKF